MRAYLQLPAAYIESHVHTAAVAPPIAVELLIFIYIYFGHKVLDHTVSPPEERYVLSRCRAETDHRCSCNQEDIVSRYVVLHNCFTA